MKIMIITVIMIMIGEGLPDKKKHAARSRIINYYASQTEMNGWNKLYMNRYTHKHI